MSCERERLLRQLQAADFALTEAVLYLDTHPTDKRALEAYDKYKARRDEANAAFTSRFGALQSDQQKPSDRFKWVDNPWPWEVEQ